MKYKLTDTEKRTGRTIGDQLRIGHLIELALPQQKFNPTNQMKFTKAELKVIHTNLFHNLAMLDAVSMLENGGEKDNTKEAKIIKSILNKISKHQR